MKLRRYLDVLRLPGVARVAAFATTGRLPFAIVPLSIVLLMRQEGYEYGQIGAVVGAEAFAVRVTAAFVGRLVDRVGRRRVILVTGAMTTLFVCAETGAILSDAPVWLLVTLAALQGATIPPISASMRALWSQLVPEETLETAYAFDAIQLELVFVIGPLTAASLATAISPAAGLLLCGGAKPRGPPAILERADREAPPGADGPAGARRGAPAICAVDRRYGVLLVLTRFRARAARDYRVCPRRQARAARNLDGGLLVADRRERDGRRRRLVHGRAPRRERERGVGARHRGHRVCGRLRGRACGPALAAAGGDGRDPGRRCGLRGFAQALRLGQRGQLAQGSLLDLAGALARELEQLGDLVERLRRLAAEPKAQFEDALVAVGQVVEAGLQPLVAHRLDRLVERRSG